MKEQVAIQALVALLASSIPSTQTLQKPSADATPLKISMPSPSSSKVEKVIHYGDISVDEEIIIPKYDYTNTLGTKLQRQCRCSFSVTTLSSSQLRQSIITIATMTRL